MASRNLFTLAGIALAVLILVAVASLIFSGRSDAVIDSGKIWTCSMHPQIRMDHAGRCPICGMDLVPLAKESEKTADVPALGNAGHHLSLSQHAREMATVETVTVEPRELFKELRTVGKVEFDETTMAYITARIAGRVDEVFADFPGTIVNPGDHLVSIYSPDLFATQNEFLASYRRGRPLSGTGTSGVDALAESSRRRLELWGITPEQVDELIRSGTPQTHLTIYAPNGGTIVEKNIRAGQYVEVGDLLYRIADLSHVWLILDIYETDLSWVRFGQEVDVTLESMPGEVFVGQVAFVEPVLNESTRTVRVRVVLRNDAGLFKPGMYAQAAIRVRILPDGGPGPTGIEGKFACPMHPYVISDEPGTCSICNMPLRQVPGVVGPTGEDQSKILAVPYTAVLTTGERQLVYVETSPGEYHLVEPKLGPRTGEYYPVIAGLEGGERVVTRGSFLLDSQFQIAGHPSLLYPEGIEGGGVGHGGHGAAGGSRDAGMPDQPDTALEKGATPRQRSPHEGHTPQR